MTFNRADRQGKFDGSPHIEPVRSRLEASGPLTGSLGRSGEALTRILWGGSAATGATHSPIAASGRLQALHDGLHFLFARRMRSNNYGKA